MTLLLLQRCHCGIILTFAIFNHQSSSLTLMSIRLVKQLSIHFTSQSTTSTDLGFFIPKDQRSSFNCFLLVSPIVYSRKRLNAGYPCSVLSEFCSVLSCDKWFCSGDREMEQQKSLKMMTVWSHSACMGPTIILGGQRWNQTMTLICQITLVMRSIWQFWQNGCHTWLSCMNQAWFSFRFTSPFNLPQ